MRNNETHSACRQAAVLQGGDWGTASLRTWPGWKRCEVSDGPKSLVGRAPARPTVLSPWLKIRRLGPDRATCHRLEAGAVVWGSR